MKIKIMTMLILFGLLLAGCNITDNDNNDNDIFNPQHQTKLYVFEECVYLPMWVSHTVNVYNYKKGTVVLDITDSCTYKETDIKHKLENTTFAFGYNNKIDIDNFIKRYNIYINSEFIQKSLFVDADNNLYLAMINPVNEETDSIFAMWRISKQQKNQPDEKLLKNKDKYRYRKDEFVAFISLLKNIYATYGNNINNLKAALLDILPSEKIALYTEEPFCIKLIIGDNIMMQCFENTEGDSLETKLLCYKQFKSGYGLFSRCTNINKFTEYIDEYYNNEFFGLYFCFDDNKIIARIRFEKNEICSLIFSSGLIYNMQFNQINENTLVLTDIHNNNQVFYFTINNNRLIFNKDISSAFDNEDLPEGAVFERHSIV